MGENKQGIKRTLQGEVTSNKMDQTVVVKVIRFFQHPLYKKYVHRSKSYQAHDATNECNIGDKVQIVECRPMSKHKRWRVKTIVRRSQL